MPTKRGVLKSTMNRVARDEKVALRALEKQAGRTQDSFQNFAARVGIGTGNISDQSSYGFNPISRVRTLLEWMYRGSWIVGQVVDCVAEDMTKAGVTFQGQNDPKTIERLSAAFQSWQIWPRLCATEKWARLYGGGVAFIEIDGQNPATPLRIETVGRGSFRGLTVFDRWMLEPSLADLVQQQGDPDRGLPRFYRVTADAPALPRQTLHHSRCVRLVGVELPYWQKISENLWGMSVLERLYDRLVAFDSGTQGASQLLYKAYLRTLKIPQLREIIAAGGPAYEGLIKQVQLMRAFQSNEGMSVIDALDDFKVDAYSFSGVNEVILQLGQQLSGASGIPLVRLFGQSPAGLNATGDADIRNYYDNIEQKQETDLRQPVDKITRVVAMSEGIALAPTFSFEFNPLWQMDDVQKADVADKITRSVSDAQASGLVGKATALKELRQQSKQTNVWSNITDEDIRKAEEDDAAAEAPQVQELDDILNRQRAAPDVDDNPEGEEDPSRAPRAPGREGFTGDSSSLPLLDWCGLSIMIETPRGTRRQGDGWSVVMPADYGYVRGTGSAEDRAGELREGMDIFLGPSRTSRDVWIVDTADLETGDFDEHKLLGGFASERHAMDCFMRAYDRPGERVMGVTRTTVDDGQFQDWLHGDDHSLPMTELRRRRRRTRDLPRIPVRAVQ